MSIDKLVRQYAKAMKAEEKRKTSGYTTTAEVVRVVGDTAYLHFPGGVDETPASMGVSCKKGDSVIVSVSNRTAVVTGNTTAPPTDDARVVRVIKEEVGAIRQDIDSGALNGEDGVGIVKIEFEYCISDEAELDDGEPSMITDDWQSNIPTIEDVPVETFEDELGQEDFEYILEEGEYDFGDVVGAILSVEINGSQFTDYTVEIVEESTVIIFNKEALPSTITSVILTYKEAYLDVYYIWMRTLTYTTDMEEGDDPEEGVPTIYGTLTAFGSKEFLVKTLIKTEIKYCLATENYIPEGETFEDIQDGYWQIDPPTLTTGKWIWQKTIYYYSDGSIEEEDPVFDAAIQLTFEAAQVAETASDTAATARSIAEAARTGVSAIENYFWTDSAGVHVSEAQKSVATGSSMTVASQGIVMMADGHLISSWTKAANGNAAAVNFYDGSNDEEIVATYNSSGASLYVGGNRMMALSASGLSLYQSDGTTVMATYSSGGVNLYSDGILANTINRNGMTVYASGAVAASFTNSSSRIYAGSNSYSEMTASGLNVVSNGTSVCSITNSQATFTRTSDSTTINTTGIGFFENGSFVGRISAYGANWNALYINAVRSNGSADIMASGVPEIQISCSKLNVPSGYIYNEPAANARDTSLAANLHINVTSGSNNYGRIIACAAASSKRYKNSIGPIVTEDIDPHRLYDIDVVQFTYNDDYLGNEKDDRYGRPLPGFIAEQIYDVYPIAIDREDGVIETWNERYIIPPMLALIQEQHEQIEALKKGLIF